MRQSDPFFTTYLVVLWMCWVRRLRLVDALPYAVHCPSQGMAYAISVSRLRPTAWFRAWDGRFAAASLRSPSIKPRMLDGRDARSHRDGTSRDRSLLDDDAAPTGSVRFDSPMQRRLLWDASPS